MIVGAALQEVKEDRLYRSTHTTFEDYCREQHDITRQYGYLLVAATVTAQNVNHGLHSDEPHVTSERQSREVERLFKAGYEVGNVVKVWRKIIKMCSGCNPSAKQIRVVVDSILIPEAEQVQNIKYVDLPEEPLPEEPRPVEPSTSGKPPTAAHAVGAGAATKTKVGGKPRQTATNPDPTTPRHSEFDRILEELKGTIISNTINYSSISIKETIVRLTEELKAWSPSCSSFSVPVPDFFDEETSMLWDAFVVLRNRQDKQVTAMAGRMIIEELTAFHEQGHDVKAILKKSLGSGWRGVFKPQTEKVNGKDTQDGNQRGTEERKAPHGIVFE